MGKCFQEPSDVLPQGDLQDGGCHRVTDDRVICSFRSLQTPGLLTENLVFIVDSKFICSVTAYTLQDDALQSGELDYINGGK